MDDEPLFEGWGLIAGSSLGYFRFIAYNGAGWSIDNAYIDDIHFLLIIPEEDAAGGPLRPYDAGELSGYNPFSTIAPQPTR